MLQTQWVVERLHEQWPALQIAIEHIRTTGDHNTTAPLARIGGDGVFVKEIEQALAERRIDLAVHSLKDVPTAQPEGLKVVAVGAREDVRDVLVWHEAGSKPEKPRIGTCSLRRTAQILALFPGADILPLRGNVNTRLRKLDTGDYDAIVLAAAGLHRLGMQERLAGRMIYLAVEDMLPAPGQGALAVEIRDEPEMQALIASLNDSATQAATSAERMFMRRLGAGCYLPVAAYGEIADGTLTLRGLVISLDGKRQVRVGQSIPWTPHTRIEQAEQLGIQLAEQALAEGAAGIINALAGTRVQEGQHA